MSKKKKNRLTFISSESIQKLRDTMLIHRKELIQQCPPAYITFNALIITDVKPYENGDRVQFMYWPNQWSVYANDIYYQPTLGLDGIV